MPKKSHRDSMCVLVDAGRATASHLLITARRVRGSVGAIASARGRHLTTCGATEQECSISMQHRLPYRTKSMYSAVDMCDV
eukprot:38742-Eustigmatos_ZCMA.PRE.1